MVVFKRQTHPKPPYLKIAVRVGNRKISASHGLKVIITNTWCGDTSFRGNSRVSSVNCVPAREGKYLTLQSKTNTPLGIGEVNIFAESRLDAAIIKYYEFIAQHQSYT